MALLQISELEGALATSRAECTAAHATAASNRQAVRSAQLAHQAAAQEASSLRWGYVPCVPAKHHDLQIIAGLCWQPEVHTGLREQCISVAQKHVLEMYILQTTLS